MKAKIVLELDTLDHKLEIQLLSRGVDMWCAMRDLEEAIRSKYKYGSAATTWGEVREMFYEHMGKYTNLGE